MACRNNCRIRMYWHFVCRRTYRTWRSSPQKLLMCISQNYIRARRKNALSVLLTFEIFSFQVIFFFSGFLVLKLFSSLQSGVPGMPGFGVTGWESSVSSPPLRRRSWVLVVAWTTLCKQTVKECQPLVRRCVRFRNYRSKADICSVKGTIANHIC